MSENHMVQGERIRRRLSRLMAGSAVAMMAVAAYALPVWIQGAEVQAQGGVGAGNGTAAATISGATNVPGVPGGTAAVSFAVATAEGESAAVGFDVIFDSSQADLSADDCQLDDRLEDQIRSVTFPPSEQPDPPNRRMRLGVFPPIADPVPSFDDGTIFVCNFGVASGLAVGTVIDLVVEPLQVARADNSVICEGDECGAVDGSILVSSATPPTATRTPSGAPATATRTPTPTLDGNTATPTSTPTGSVTEETATPTSTPTEGTPVAASPTNTRAPTATPTTVGVTPTNTSVPVTPTATAVTARTPDFDDSCAIVPVAQSSSNRSLLLLLVPGLLLWARRRVR